MGVIGRNMSKLAALAKKEQPAGPPKPKLDARGFTVLGDEGSVRTQAMKDNTASREAALTEQFSNQRRQVKGTEREAVRQSGRAFDRFAAQIGGSTGATLQARNQGQRDLSTKFGEVEAGLGAQEAAARQQILSQAGDQEFARTQFLETGEITKDSFAQEMGFKWAELDENKRIDILNAAAVIKDAGINNANDWAKMSEVLESIFGEGRAPGSSGGNIIPAGFDENGVWHPERVSGFEFDQRQA
jgi:hypothetical protein